MVGLWTLKKQGMFVEMSGFLQLGRKVACEIARSRLSSLHICKRAVSSDCKELNHNSVHTLLNQQAPIKLLVLDKTGHALAVELRVQLEGHLRCDYLYTSPSSCLMVSPSLVSSPQTFHVVEWDKLSAASGLLPVQFPLSTVPHAHVSMACLISDFLQLSDLSCWQPPQHHLN